MSRVARVSTRWFRRMSHEPAVFERPDRASAVLSSRDHARLCCFPLGMDHWRSCHVVSDAMTTDIPDDFGMGMTTGYSVPFFWEQYGVTVRTYLIGSLP